MVHADDCLILPSCDNTDNHQGLLNAKPMVNVHDVLCD